MLTIHHLQNSQSERILWLCEELEVPYVLKLYQRDPILAPPSLKSLTPMGASPVITDDDNEGFTLSESSAVVEYILHKYPSRHRLALPPTHPDYAAYLYWFHFANSNLQPAMGALFRVAYTGIAPDHRIYQMAAAVVRKVLKNMDLRLAQVTWLAGEEFTAADVMSGWSLTGMRVFTPVDLSGYPSILAWMERVSQRRAYKAAMAKGDPGRHSCMGGPPPPVFPGLGKAYRAYL